MHTCSVCGRTLKGVVQIVKDKPPVCVRASCLYTILFCYPKGAEQ